MDFYDVEHLARTVRERKEEGGHAIEKFEVFGFKEGGPFIGHVLRKADI
jgi:hypothetical protein